MRTPRSLFGLSALWLVAALTLFVISATVSSALHAALFVFVGLLMAGLAVLFALVGLSWSILGSTVESARRAVQTRSQSIVQWADSNADDVALARLLSRSALLAKLDGRTPEQRVADRVSDIHQRYVAGELGEAAFEAELAAVFDELGAQEAQRNRDAQLRRDVLNGRTTRDESGDIDTASKPPSASDESGSVDPAAVDPDTVFEELR